MSKKYREFQQRNKEKKVDVLNNSLAGLTAEITGYDNYGMWAMPTPQSSKIDTVQVNTRPELISNYRTTLSYAYAEYGIVQTLCEQPALDAFRTGFSITAKDLTTEQIAKIESFVSRKQFIKRIIEAITWSRLYGGGALIVNSRQNPSTLLNREKLYGDTSFDLISADMWELFPDKFEGRLINPLEEKDPSLKFNYRGQAQLNQSRVICVYGKKAPSFLEPRLRGWGMSELERVVRSINSYLKNQNLIFELLDEAKIDVYQLNRFNESMMTPQGTEGVRKRVQLANSLKNYLNALVMDSADKYEQKQLSFGGLAEILGQIRLGVASDLKMPLTKLFGVSAAGFNSGEDDIENYNSMVESEIRSQVKYIVIEVLELVCANLFGFVPENLNIEFKPLRSLSAEQEENKKNSEFNRLIQTFSNGLCTLDQFMLGCDNSRLLPFLYGSEAIESAQNLNRIEVQQENDKAGIMARLKSFVGGNADKGVAYPEKPEKGVLADENGKVKETDVTSNKFTKPDREKKPLPDLAFPYKAKEKARYVKVGG